MDCTEYTLKYLLDHCNFRADVVILGDSAPMPPVLFDCGVDAESGTKVENANIALWCMSEGVNFIQLKGVRGLTMMK